MSYSTSQSPKTGATSSHSTPSSADAADHLGSGSLVFAKMKSFPPWPAKVISAEEFPGSVPRHHVPVLFLGSGDYGHVAVKDCFPYVEYRNQFGTPKQRPKFAEGLREADDLLNQPVSRKRPLRSPSPKAASAGPSPMKKPRGRPPKSKKPEMETDKSQGKEEVEEGMGTSESLLPSSQHAGVTTVSAPLEENQAAAVSDESPEKQPSLLRSAGDQDDEVDADDAISNVVRQLEELEKQEPTMGNTSHDDISPSSAPKRRGRPPKSRLSSEMSPSNLIQSPQTLENMEQTNNAPSRISHERSLSETTDDGRTPGGQASGGEAASNGGDGGQLGKRRHKPKIMSDYFLEYDYASPRTHRKSESSSAATTPMTPSAQSQPTKSQQPKAPKAPVVERTSKATATRPKKMGSTSSGAKSTKEMEKAALEEEIERVKMAAEENQAEQQQVASDQLWQRHDEFADLPFDDSMFEAGTFEVTVDVEETPSGSGVGHPSFVAEPSAPISQAAAKRRKDAAEIQKEKDRHKQKSKLKVKLLKELLPAPRNLPGTSATDGRKKKGKSSSAVSYAKHKSLAVGKMKVKIAKKRALKAAKVVAAAEMKVKKKRGRPPLMAKKVPLTKRSSGYGLWAEHEMDLVREQHPEVKTLRDIKELLQDNWRQLADNERKTWKILAKRENERRSRDSETGVIKEKGQAAGSSSPGAAAVAARGEVKRGRGRPKGSVNSQKRHPPSSPRGPRNFPMSPTYGTQSSIDMSQQQYSDQSTGSINVSYLQAADSSYGSSTYPSHAGGQTAGASFGVHSQGYSQSSVTTLTPIKRPRGRPPKHAKPPVQQFISPPEGSAQQDAQATASYMGYQGVQPLPKGLKIPRKESAKIVAKQQQAKTPLKILSVDQRQAQFQARSPQALMQQHVQQPFMSGGLDEPPVPEAMSHEELVYDSESAAMAAAAAAMDLTHEGIMADDGMTEEVAYGHIGEQRHHQHEELGEETAAAVSFLTGDEPSHSDHGSPGKSKAQLEEERAARKRESRRRSRARQKMLKEQRKLEAQAGKQQGPHSAQGRQKNRDLAVAQFATEQGAYGEQTAAIDSPAAYEVAYVEPQPSEEETNMFFFGTPQDVQSLLEMRNPPAAMEGLCRWWLADEIDPELQGAKTKGVLRGLSPPRGLTAEPLDAAAVFKLIGRSFETVGNQLMREENEDTPHEVAAGMDMLLDALVGAVTHLLTLTGAVPPFDRRYRGDVFTRLVEETAMMIPL